MDFSITNENINQVLAGVHENVKSNQHRIDELEPVIKIMSIQVERMDTMLIGNGFIKAVQSNAAAARGINKQLQEFQLHRKETCPMTKREDELNKVSSAKRDWRLKCILAILAIAGFGLSFYVGIMMV